MSKVLYDFISRNLPGHEDEFEFEIKSGEEERFCLIWQGDKLCVSANSAVNAAHGIYEYLKEFCGVQLSWCGNRQIKIDILKRFNGNFTRTYPQKYRVYMNYCTLDYSMCWWDFSRWEKEIDFMAMNGINMPLAVVGCEAVWYETLLQLGFTSKEALSTVSGPAFWAWQMMTNIEGYMPPEDEKYIYERLELGKRILKRYVDFGMTPIQQGFSGHVPVLLKNKFPNAKILLKAPWCGFPKTAQLDPLDPLFKRIGRLYLENLKRHMGFYHYAACDPFHEGTPPKRGKRYLWGVGKAIDSLYKEFDPDSVWVMQAWTLREHIVKAVPKNRLLVLDLNSRSTPAHKNMWGYPVVAGMLHNFGGKNAMQGKLKEHCENIYLKLKSGGANAVGAGLFMEGIEQNPVVYDLQFELLTAAEKIDLDKWIKKYITRRYGNYSEDLYKVWQLLLQTCYKSNGYEENQVGSALASRPQLLPVMTGSCCYAKVFYNTVEFEKAAALFASLADHFSSSDGYQYDLCDIIRQALSNRFYTNQIKYRSAYKRRNLIAIKELGARQLDLLKDIDKLLSHRSELCFERWLFDAQSLASDEKEQRWFDFNARTLLTIWGDYYSKSPHLFDYAWREWHTLVGDYYYTRWKMFYSECEKHIEHGVKFKPDIYKQYKHRLGSRKSDFGKRLDSFEHAWCREYSKSPAAQDSDVISCARALISKWKIGA